MMRLKCPLEHRRPDAEAELEIQPVQVGLALAGGLPGRGQRTRAAVDRLATRDCRKKTPLRQRDGVAGLRMQVEALDDASSDEPRLRALQSGSRPVEFQLQPGAAQAMVGAEERECRHVEDPHLLALHDVFDSLVPVGEQSQLHPVACMRGVRSRDDVGRDREVEAVRKRLPVGVAGEVINVGGEPGLLGEVVAAGQQKLFSALVLRGRAAVQHLRVVRGRKVRLWPAKMERRVLSKADA